MGTILFLKLNMSKQKYFFLSIFFFVVGLILHYLPKYDYFLLDFFNSNFYNEEFFQYFTEIGNGYIVAGFVIPLLSYASYRLKALNFVPLSALIFPTIYLGIINGILKREIFSFERPGFYRFENIEYLEPVFKYGSFPSGHAATIFVVIFIWLGLAVKKGYQYKFYLHGSLIALASLVALSRVIVGAHWFSDILASLGIALLFRFLVEFNFFYNHIAKTEALKYLAYLVVVIAWINILFFDVSKYF